MAKTIISEGKTSTEAIEKGLKEIGLPKELVEIKIIEQNKKSFFDILAPKIVKVEIKEKETIETEKKEIETTENELIQAKNNIEKFLKEFINKLSSDISYSIEIKDKCLYVYINGNNVGMLIGYRGETLFALENYMKALANKNSENKVIIRLDIANYKQKRVKILEEVAIKKAKVVEKTGKAITLEPMQAYERKIIHSVLQNNPKINTKSIGQEPKRRVVIIKK